MNNEKLKITHTPHNNLHSGAHNQNRTGDLFLTKEVLCRLSYMGKNQLQASSRKLEAASS
jgi:hypothetical protein